MATENFKEAGEIFQNAIEIDDPAKREQYLKNICKNDPELRAEVEALLKAHEKAGDYLEAPAVGVNVTIDGSAQIEGPGTKIDRYELLSLIGEGGMGLVYLAEQKEPVKRRVALKIIKPGMDSRQVIARFEAERQALALLDHPNIAHVFDAGTTETGRPYFVMEYVKGMSITAYCDQRKLNIEQRLRLFEQVCEAIHHAHQKGIIHRDIKPSNILVSVHGDRAVPKIIDFGIAKAITQPLTEKTFVTFQGQLLGTPEYMSPEQVDLAIQDIDIRSDIYSLGVVLYELLAGLLPFEREWLAHLNFSEMQRTIREQEPASPSIRLTKLGPQAKTIAARRGTQLIALARCLHRELEWIPLKAMRKDRCRRYKSASEMADDVRNYLNGNPLIAGPETTVYRVNKFIRKHVGSVATVILVATAIVFGLIVSTAMYFRAERMRLQADQARQKEVIARTEAEQAARKEAAARAEAEQAERAIKDKAEELRQNLYVNSIQLADAKYKEGDIRQVHKVLDSCPQDLRGWEWDYLNFAADESVMVYKGHDLAVRSVAVSRDSKRVVSGGQDGKVKIWDAETGAEIATLIGHTEDVFSVAIDRSGKLIASGSLDNTIRLWDMNTHANVLTIERAHSEWVTVVAFSPDGKHLFSCCEEDRNVKMWDIKTGSQLRTYTIEESAGPGVYFIAVSPSGKQIVLCTDTGLEVREVTAGSTLATFREHPDKPVCAAFNNDGKQIVSVDSGGDMRIWNAQTGTRIVGLWGSTNAMAVAFSSDGTQIASGGVDNTITIWDVATGKAKYALRGHESKVTCIAFNPEGQWLISGSWDGTIRKWDSAAGRTCINLSCQTYHPYSLAFSPDGKLIAAGTDTGVIKIWNADNGLEIGELIGHNKRVTSIAFDKSGRCIVSGSLDETVKIWEVSTRKKLKTFYGHRQYVTSVAFTPNEKQILSGGYDNAIRIWDIANGQESAILEGHTRWVSSVAVTPDGRYAISGSWDGTIKIWDLAAKSEVKTLRSKMREAKGIGQCFVITISPDGKWLAAGWRDGIIELWEWQKDSQPRIFESHQDWVYFLLAPMANDLPLAALWAEESEYGRLKLELS
jgi:WD40 repeat protein/serine/threonine protein kinase